MTRTRKATGHISFVGAGPGDPGLLTQRALEALASADHVVFDRGIPEPLLGTVRAGAHEEAQFSPAEGASGDVAKVLLSAARSGLHAVHLVAGDPFGHESVVREVQAVARAGLPFAVVPGIGQAAVVAASLGFAGRVVLAFGAAVANRDKLSWWENRPLYGWKVLVPRTKEQAGAMSERLRAYGAIPCEVPTIAVEPPRTPAQMERAIKGLVDGRYAWVVFTSVNAVRAVWEKFAEHGLDARHFGGVKIACIGEATAAAVRDFGIQPELVPAGEQASEGLLAEFSPHDEVLDPVGRVLLPRADIATETLAAGLTERGWEVDDVTAYRTVRAAPPPAEIRDAIKSGGFDAVLFTSSSTVRNLVGIAGKPHARTVVAVIGPKTADTAVEFGLRVDVQPPHASVPDLVEALASYAVELREKLATMPAKQRRGSKVQGPTALRFR